MSKRQQLYNLIMGAYAGLPEAASVASHHMNAVKEKNALKHWQIHGPGIQQAAEARRNQLRMQNAPKEPVLQRSKEPTLTTAELSSTLETGRGGLRSPKLKVGKGKNIAKLKTSEYINPMGGGMTATPYGSSLNLA